MNISDILRTKGHDVVTIPPDRTVLDAMRVLVEHRIGAVVVVQGEDIRGILSERDVLRLGSRDPALLRETRIADVMTTELVVGVPGDGLDYVMEIMTRNRVRHLPIIANGRLAGMVSIGDVVNACRRTVEAENRYMREYIQGAVS